MQAMHVSLLRSCSAESGPSNTDWERGFRVTRRIVGSRRTSARLFWRVAAVVGLTGAQGCCRGRSTRGSLASRGPPTPSRPSDVAVAKSPLEDIQELRVGVAYGRFDSDRAIRPTRIIITAQGGHTLSIEGVSRQPLAAARPRSAAPRPGDYTAPRGRPRLNVRSGDRWCRPASAGEARRRCRAARYIQTQWSVAASSPPAMLQEMPRYVRADERPENGDVRGRPYHERWELLRQIELAGHANDRPSFIWLGLMVLEFTVGLSRPRDPQLRHLGAIRRTAWLGSSSRQAAYLRQKWLTAIALLLPAFACCASFVRSESCGPRAARSLSLLRLVVAQPRHACRRRAARGVGYVATLTTIVTLRGARSPVRKPRVARVGFPAESAPPSAYGATAMIMTTMGSALAEDSRVASSAGLAMARSRSSAISATTSFFMGQDATAAQASLPRTRALTIALEEVAALVPRSRRRSSSPRRRCRLQHESGG